VHFKLNDWILAGAVRQPLFSVILSNFVYVWLQNFRRCKRPRNRLTPGVAYLQIAYGQTAGVHKSTASSNAQCALVLHYVCGISSALKGTKIKAY